MKLSPRFLTLAILLTAACSNGPDQSDASVDGGKDVVVKDVNNPPQDVQQPDAPPPPPAYNLDCTGAPGNDAGSSDAGSSDAALDADLDAAVDADLDANVEAGSLDAGTSDAGGSTKGSCVVVNDAGISCNPITNAGCNPDAGEACDFSQSGFQCWDAPPNTAAVCASCDLQNGPACLPTLTCVDQQNGTFQCARYCCANSDCGSGHCDTTYASPVGICVQ